MNQTGVPIDVPPEEELLWLKDLRERVSKVEWWEDKFGSYKVRVCTKKLTMQEFVHMCEIAPHFIVVPQSAQFRFNFGVSLCIEPEAIYPGVEPECECVFFISGEYLPDDIGQRFENSWNALSPLSHTEANRVKLARNGFGPPEEKNHYAY